MPALAKTLLSFATIALLHAAYSTYEHLSQLKALDRPQDHPLPHDIVIESVVALLVGLFGAVLNTPALKEITWSSEMQHRTVEEMDSRLSFANFNHKGKKLFGIQTALGDWLEDQPPWLPTESYHAGKFEPL